MLVSMYALEPTRKAVQRRLGANEKRDGYSANDQVDAYDWVSVEGSSHLRKSLICLQHAEL